MECLPLKLGATLESLHSSYTLFIHVIKIFSAKYPRDQPYRLYIFVSEPF